MYEAYQAQADLLWPVRNFTKAFLPSLKEGRHAWSQWEPTRKLAAAWEVFGLSEITHRRRPFGIDQASVTGAAGPVAIADVRGNGGGAGGMDLGRRRLRPRWQCGHRCCDLRLGQDRFDTE